MGRYESPNIIQGVSTKSITDAAASGLKKGIGAWMENAEKRKKANEDLLNKVNSQYQNYADAAFESGDSGLEWLNDDKNRILQEAGREYYNLSLEMEKDPSKVVDLQLQRDKILQLPKNYAESFGALQHWWRDLDQSLSKNPNDPGYPVTEMMDDRLLAYWNDIKQNKGRNIEQEYDLSGNIYYVLNREDQEPIRLNSNVFVSKSLEGQELTPKIPDMNKTVAPFVDQLKDEIGYANGTAESRQTKFGSKTWRNFSGRNAVVGEGISTDGFFAGVYTQSTFKNGFGSLMSRYGDAIDPELKQFNGQDITAEYIANDKVALENGKKTEVALAQERLADELLKVYTMDPANGFISMNQEDRVLQTESSTYGGAKGGGGGGDAAVQLTKTDFDKLWETKTDSGLDELVEWANQRTIVGGIQYFTPLQMAAKFQEIAEYEKNLGNTEGETRYNALSDNAMNHAGRFRTIYEYDPETGEAKAIGDLDKENSKASVWERIKTVK